MKLRIGPMQRDVIAGSLATSDMCGRRPDGAATGGLQSSMSHLAFPHLWRVERDGGVYRRLL